MFDNDDNAVTHAEPIPEGVEDDTPAAPALPPIATQEASTVGDENMEPRKPTFEVNAEEVPAQVMGKPAPAVEVVPVHETFVATDTVITDTSDPLAVQIPDAGRGDASLPMHRLTMGTVEEYFAKS